MTEILIISAFVLFFILLVFASRKNNDNFKNPLKKFEPLPDIKNQPRKMRGKRKTVGIKKSTILIQQAGRKTLGKTFFDGK